MNQLMSDSTFLHTLNDFFLSLSLIRGASEIENNDLFGVVVTVATIVHLPHELVLVIIDSAQIIFRTQYINFHNDLPQKKRKGLPDFSDSPYWLLLPPLREPIYSLFLSTMACNLLAKWSHIFGTLLEIVPLLGTGH